MKTETRAKLEARLRYYEDLGIRAFFRDRAPADSATTEPLPATQAAPPGDYHAVAASEQRSPSPPVTPSPAAGERPGPPPAFAAPLPVVQSPGLFDAVDRIEGDTLERIRADLGDCSRCRLCQKRTNIVFGVGSEEANLVFVGEAPGADEDAQGIPFVGRAGQLLTQMVDAMGLKRSQVYICNVIKCRPPENRSPEKDEIATCSPFLFRQLDAIRPKVIVCLGAVAAQTLLNTNLSMGRLRGQWFDYRGAKLLATYHPAYLLRNPAAKPDVWKDLQLAMAELGLPLPAKKK